MENGAQKVVLIADRPHGDRVDRELRALGHSVIYVQDEHGHAYFAIRPGMTWVLAMNWHSEPDRLKEKARECGARWLPLPIGWSKSAEKLRQSGFPLSPTLDLIPEPEPEPLPMVPEVQAAPLALVPAPVRQADAGLFMFEAQAVRVVGAPEDLRFVVADVCAALELGRTNDAVSGLDADEKGTDTIRTPGGPQELLTVTEPGLYALLARSRKPAAKRFDRWVRHEVLPSIRKTGTYSAAPVPEPEDMLLARAVLIGDRKIKLLQAKNAEQAQALAATQAQVEELIPAKVALATIADSTGERPPIEAGKIWHVTNATEVLVDLGYAYRRGGRAMPRAQYGHAGSGLLNYRTLPAEKCNGKARDQMYVTNKGLVVIAERLVLEGLTGADVLAEIRKQYGRRPEAA